MRIAKPRKCVSLTDVQSSYEGIDMQEQNVKRVLSDPLAQELIQSRVSRRGLPTLHPTDFRAQSLLACCGMAEGGPPYAIFVGWGFLTFGFLSGHRFYPSRKRHQIRPARGISGCTAVERRPSRANPRVVEGAV